LPTSKVHPITISRPGTIFRTITTTSFSPRPVDEETFRLALEDWEIWLRWERAFYAGNEWDSRALLSLVLVGLSEMQQRMNLARNRSLWSRIHTRVHLGEAKDDTAEYLQHRLARAGADSSLFTSDAIAMLHDASAGRLRDIDRIATDALQCAARRSSKSSIASSSSLPSLPRPPTDCSLAAELPMAIAS
jgi:hypothetical protein